MPAAKIAITIDPALLEVLDLWVAEGRFPNRSKAVQAAVREHARRWRRERLARECAKVNRREQQAMAEEIWEGEVLPWIGD